MRDAWSEKLTFFARPSIVCTAVILNDVETSFRSAVLVMTGITSCRYSSILTPNAKMAWKTLPCVLWRFSVGSPSNI